MLLHGLLGNRKNVRSLARSIVKAHPDWRVLLLDLRGHGESTALNRPSDEFLQKHGDADNRNRPSLFDVAEDVAFTMSEKIEGLDEPPHMICGHSMGGKVALAYLYSAMAGYFDGKYFPLHGSGAALAPKYTWTLDTVPQCVDRAKAVSDEKESVASVLARVGSVPLPVASTMALMDALKDRGSSDAVAQWMCTNLVKQKEGGYVFNFHLPTCEALFDDYSNRNFLPLVELVAEGKQGKCTLDIVRAGRNDTAWPREAVSALEGACRHHSCNGRSNGDGALAAVHVLKESGHNVHIDDPRGLLELMESSFLLER